MDPPSIAGALSLAKSTADGGVWALQALKIWVVGRDASAAMHDAELTYYAELTPLFERRLAELEDTEKNRKCLDDLLSDELRFILRNYELENRREATRKRRIMLAHATAGSLRLDLTIAQIARVERAIRELDPDDVRALARLGLRPDPEQPTIAQDQEHHRQDLTREWQINIGKTAHSRYVSWKGGWPAGQVLASAGCVYIEPSAVFGARTGVYITRVGHDVLKVLETYIRDEGFNQ